MSLISTGSILLDSTFNTFCTHMKTIMKFLKFCPINPVPLYFFTLLKIDKWLQIYRGKLVEAEDNMNSQMSGVTVTFR
jgi:hypothetical protein